VVGLLGSAEYLLRALHLLALALFPGLLSPEPVPPSGAMLPLEGLGALVLLGLLLYGAARLRARVASRAARAGAVLVWIAVAASLVAALVYSHERAPLLRGLPIVAGPVWAAVIALAAGMAERWPGWTWKPRQAVAALVVLALGAVQLVRARPLFASTEAMWWSALDFDSSHTRAIDELSRPLLRAHKLDEADKLVDQCLMAHPGACACLDLRSRVALAAHRPDAVAVARVGAQRCPAYGQAHATLAEALAQGGDLGAAEQEARTSLAQGGPGDRLHYVLALILERTGQYAEARGEVNQALALGAGRDAKLLSAALAIVSGDLEAAQAILDPLSKADADDAEVLYDLALIADKKGDFNRARQGYLAALKADPRSASARYNLALLTWRFGVKEESQHHLQKFKESFPMDPRGFQLAQTLAGPPPKR
jgi:Flp pilus assembly protein TadD